MKTAQRQTKMVRHTDMYFDFLDRYKDALVLSVWPSCRCWWSPGPGPVR